MEKENARKQTLEQLHERRKQVVRLHKKAIDDQTWEGTDRSIFATLRDLFMNTLPDASRAGIFSMNKGLVANETGHGSLLICAMASAGYRDPMEGCCK